MIDRRIGLLALMLGAAACERTQLDTAPSPAGESAARGTPSEQTQPTQSAQQAQARDGAGTPQLTVAGVGSCEPAAQVSTAIERLAKMADADGNGQVSRSEATALANFAIGGGFFRADSNADGTITPEEGREVRREFSDRYPEFGAILSSANASGRKPVAALAALADVQYGKPLSIEEARRSAKTVVDDLFRVADKDGSGAIGLDEARSTSFNAAQALGREAFQAADGDKDGRLSRKELDALISTPVNHAFQLADEDKDGGLTQQEAARALQRLPRSVGIPMAADSSEAKAM